ncbi:DUF4266 domain-containing protein [Hahella sp. SMD15-11]|uniref:DUF4266 domain-containing protein n=1 Tax=Thermohahella caldifontis TaxID=3142973 RepID=A0AB39UUW1_9GAMM
MKSFVVCACLVSALLAGCAEVKPWQRGELARTEMAFDPDAMQSSLKDHVYFSKEASSGGATAGGGGCGCN